MSNRTIDDVVDNDMPRGPVTRVSDFLPSPEYLVMKEPRERITIELSDFSLDYFREQSARLRVPYQRIIRNLLDEYVARMKAEA